MFEPHFISNNAKRYKKTSDRQKTSVFFNFLEDFVFVHLFRFFSQRMVLKKMKNHLESLIALEYSVEVRRIEIVCVCLCSFIVQALSKR